jgi:hypothetical protein
MRDEAIWFDLPVRVGGLCITSPDFNRWLITNDALYPSLLGYIPDFKGEVGDIAVMVSPGRAIHELPLPGDLRISKHI